MATKIWNTARFIVVLILLLILIMPSVAKAQEYDPELDVLEVIEIRTVSISSAPVREYALSDSKAIEYLKQGTHLYIVDSVENYTGLEYLKIRLSEDVYGWVFSGFTGYEGLIPTQSQKSISEHLNASEGVSQENSGNGAYYWFTAYCSACNSPKHTDQTSSGNTPVPRATCAAKLSNGTIIDTPYGILTVNDTPGSNVIDIWVGWRDSCNCVNEGISGKHWVSW